DDPSARAILRTFLAGEGFTVFEAADGVEALALLRTQGADAVLADVRIPGVDGVALVRVAREEGLPVDFVMMTALENIEEAVEAMRAGAESFLLRPTDPSIVRVVLEKVLEKRRLAKDAEQLRERVRQRYRLDALIGDSAALQA